MDLNTIYNEECLEGMKKIEDKSVDMILCDLPYGTTRNKWDSIIPFDELWREYNRIIKDNGAIVLTSAQPFTSSLVMSNIKNFKYSWTWDKKLSTGHLNAKKQPLRRTEDICIFYKKPPTYNPQIVKRDKKRVDKASGKVVLGDGKQSYGEHMHVGGEYDFRYPTNILEFSNANRKNKTHPTQKPLELFEYLIKTYTNEGETVLDNCMGSGTTAIACINTNRNYIGFELDEGYYKASLDRIEKHKEENAN